MKGKLIAVAAVAASALGAPAYATDVGVHISVGQPGFYGQIDIGGYPPPALVYREPVVVERTYVTGPPMYLHVPPGHAKNWRRYCGRYDACGHRVYFVQDDWYNREYVPRYQERHGNPHRKDGDYGPHGKGGHGHGKGHDRD